LVSLAEELDNFPAGDTDPYEALYSFPDEIMRKDVLEELQPYVSRPLPRPPVVPACSHCAANNVVHLFGFSPFPIELCNVRYQQKCVALNTFIFNRHQSLLQRKEKSLFMQYSLWLRGTVNLRVKNPNVITSD